MKTKILLVILLSFLSISLWQCSEDEIFSGTGSDATAVDPYETVQNSRIATVISNQTLTTTLVGVVTNTSGIAQAGVLVKSGDAQATTEIDGTYILNNAKINKDFVKVTAEKDGYFLAIKTFTPSASTSLNTINLQLSPKGSAVSFTSSSGGKVVFGNKIEIEFDANQIVKEEDGTPYDGNVNVYSQYYNPTATNFPEAMPGNLNGFDLANNFVALDSYGMMTVEMTDAAGNPLNIAKGQKVKIKIPVPTGAGITPPTTIPLWRLNETYGIWFEVGTATKNGAFYEGEVDHFSFYGMNQSFNDPYKLNLQLKDKNNNILRNQKAYVKVNGRNNKLAVYTNDNGEFELYNANNQSNYIFILPSECDSIEQIFERFFDLLDNILNRKVIVVSFQKRNTYSFSGLVDSCDNYISSSDDFIQIMFESEGKSYKFNGKINQNGQFTTDSKIFCESIKSNVNIEINIYNNNTKSKYSYNQVVSFNNQKITLNLNPCLFNKIFLGDEYPFIVKDPNFQSCIKKIFGRDDSEYVSIREIKNIKHLYMDLFTCSYHNIKNLEGIGQMENLETISLTSNFNLTTLPPEIGNLKKLTNFSIKEHSKLLAIPKELGDLSNLETIEIEENYKLEELPNEIGGLKKVVSLELDRNNLKSIPKGIGGMISLTRITASQNELTTLPSEIGDLNNLKQLLVSQNKLNDLPLEIGKLSQLNYLSLGSNDLIDLPLTIGNLKNVSTFSVEKNQFTNIPKEICDMSALFSSTFEQNQLSTLPNCFDKLKHLQFISFYKNPNLKGKLSEIGLCRRTNVWPYDGKVDVGIEYTQLINDCP